MKMLKVFAAAALAMSGIAGASTAAHAAPMAATGAGTLAVTAALAGAQDGRYRNDDRRWDRNRQRGWDRGRQRGWDRGRHNRGRYYNRGRNHRVCWNEWRHHQRVTVCRRR